MGKKKHAEEHENLERWLVSYADFMTLLFATFVVLYALSQMDLAKFKDLKDSIRKAFSAPTIIDSQSSGAKKSDDPSVLESSGESILDSSIGQDPITPIMETVEKKAESDNFNEIKDNLDKLGNESGINAEITDRGLVISLNDNVFFKSGSAEITKQLIPKLNNIGAMLKSKVSDHTIRIEGHTDNLPAKSVIYASNWELSSGRASSVVRYLIDNYKFDKNIFAAIGYGDSKPISPNNTEIGRSKNRRVEIVVLRNKFLKSEPRMANLDKLRVEKIREYSAKNHIRLDDEPITEVAQDSQGMSDAARKLMQGNENNVINYKDAYDIESENLANELKALEQKVKIKQ